MFKIGDRVITRGLRRTLTKWPNLPKLGGVVATNVPLTVALTDGHYLGIEECLKGWTYFAEDFELYRQPTDLEILLKELES